MKEEKKNAQASEIKIAFPYKLVILPKTTHHAPKNSVVPSIIFEITHGDKEKFGRHQLDRTS